jgi:hypothetical protein
MLQVKIWQDFSGANAYYSVSAWYGPETEFHRDPLFLVAVKDTQRSLINVLYSFKKRKLQINLLVRLLQAEEGLGRAGGASASGADEKGTVGKISLTQKNLCKNSAHTFSYITALDYVTLSMKSIIARQTTEIRLTGKAWSDTIDISHLGPYCTLRYFMKAPLRRYSL